MFKNHLKTILIFLILKCVRGDEQTIFQTDLNCRLTCSKVYSTTSNADINAECYKGATNDPVESEVYPEPNENSNECSTFTEIMNELNELKKTNEILRSKDCSDEIPTVKGTGKTTIYPFFNKTGLEVFCDQHTYGGGWTIIQRRVDDSVDFYRNWTEYQRGFGDLDTNFWLGLDNIYELMKFRSHEVRFDMEDFENNTRYAQFSEFTVGPSSSNYVMTINGYFGDAGDAVSRNSGQQFSTYNADHDTYAENCAERYKGGWWYDKCHESNPNGLYLGGPHSSYADGIEWRQWTGYNYSLKKIDIKIRKRKN